MNDIWCKIKLIICLWWRCTWYANYSISLRNKAIKHYKKARKLLRRQWEDRSCIKCKVTTYTDLAAMYSNMADKFDIRSEFYRRKLQKMSMKLVK